MKEFQGEETVTKVNGKVVNPRLDWITGEHQMYHGEGQLPCHICNEPMMRGDLMFVGFLSDRFGAVPMHEKCLLNLQKN